MKGKLKAAAAMIGVCILILDSATALNGVKDGIQICLRTVIPSLFPFLVLCGLLTGTSGSWEIKPLEILCRICKFPPHTSDLLLSGMLGGYPIGARSVSQAYTKGQLTKQQAQRILPLCNNCGPAFLFGMVSQTLEDPWSCWILWGILILSVISTAQLLPSCERTETRYIGDDVSITFVQALENGLRSMISICGWVIIFKMAINFLDKWILWTLPPTLKIVIIGGMELSNGCISLLQIDNERTRFILCAGMLAFGGLSVTMQTWSVIAPDLDKKLYLKGKTIQCSICLTLAWIFQTAKRSPTQATIGLLISISAATICTRLQKKMRDGSRFSRTIHV